MGICENMRLCCLIVLEVLRMREIFFVRPLPLITVFQTRCLTASLRPSHLYFCLPTGLLEHKIILTTVAATVLLIEYAGEFFPDEILPLNIVDINWWLIFNNSLS